MKGIRVTILIAIIYSCWSTSIMAQWVQMGLPTEKVMSVAVKSNGDVYAGTYDHGVLRSTDNGTSWYNRLGSVQGVYEVYCISFSPNGNIYVGSYAAGLFLSTNDGLSWGCLSSDNGSNNLPVDDIYAVGITSSGATDTLVALDGSLLNGDVYQSTDGGTTWSEIIRPSAGVYNLAVGGSNTVFIGGGDGFRYSTNAGSNWTSAGTGLGGQPYCLTASSPTTLYAGTQGHGVYRSYNAGVLWTAVNNGLTDMYVNCLAITRDSCIFAGTHTHGVYYSVDRGNNWKKYNAGLADTNILALAFDKLGNLYAGTNSKGIWRLPLVDVALPVEMASYKAIVNKNGVELSWVTRSEINNLGFNVLRKQRGESDYQTIASFVSLPSLHGTGTSTTGRSYNYTDSKVVQGKSYDYELVQESMQGTSKIYGPIEVTCSAIPLRFALYQNYPNPFNPTTEVSYQLADDSNVSLKVYDVLGREVATLVNEKESAGNHSVKFDASRLSSGIYFYKIAATVNSGDRFTSTMKFLLTK